MAIRFFDGEVFSIDKDALNRSQLLIFFLNGHRDEPVIVNDRKGRYYGFLSYYSLLNSSNMADAVIKEKIYLGTVFDEIENIRLRYSYVNIFPVLGKNDEVLYLAQDDPEQAVLWEKLIFLEQNFKESGHGIWAEMPHIHIRGISETLYNLVLFLKRNGLSYSVEEESWKEFDIECSVENANWQLEQIAGPDGQFIERMYDKLMERNQIPEWNAQRWKDFCQDLKSRNRPIVFCGCTGFVSEKVYDALLKEGVVPSAVLSSCTYQFMFGQETSGLLSMEESLYCVAGDLEQIGSALMLEEALRKEKGYCDNIYLLSEVGYCVPDCMLKNLIHHCRKMVLMGHERLCRLFIESCLKPDGINVTYLADVDKASASLLADCGALWFYLELPSADETQYRKSYAACSEKGIYLSRYFMDHYEFCKGFSHDGFKLEESKVLECLQSMGAQMEESHWFRPISRIRQRMLFFSTEYAYFWDNLMPLFQYYANMDGVECTVLLERASSLLNGFSGTNNFAKMADNMRKVREAGGKVCWYYDCNQYRRFDVAFLCHGYSEYRIASMKEGFCGITVSVQTTPFYVHIYNVEGEFERVFGKQNFESVDYLVTSCYFEDYLVRRDDTWKQKILPFGYPRMDYLYVKLHNAQIPDEWKQKAAGKKVILFTEMYSEWIRYCLDYGKEAQGAIVIFRPHPLALDGKKSRAYIEELEREANIIIDRNPSYAASFQISDALITTPFSSVVANYLFMDKPVLLFEDEREPLEDYSKEAWYRASYVAVKEEDGKRFIDMIMEGRDDRWQEQALYRSLMKKNYDGKVCERIVEFLNSKI